MIEVQNLTCVRQGRPVLSDVTTRVPRGGITALIGPNGAGKSSLLHCMAGLLEVENGAIRVDGTDIIAARPDMRARSIALLTQSQSIATRLTVKELVSFGRWPHHRGRPGAEDRAQVAKAMAAFDLDAVASQSLETLSGGQKQRAFIAMAHAQTTPWMLLDEPLAALDPRYAKDIMTRLVSLTHEGSAPRSVVVVLHDLGAAARYADHVIALKDGRVYAEGARADVLIPEILTGLYDTAFATGRVDGYDVVFPA